MSLNKMFFSRLAVLYLVLVRFALLAWDADDLSLFDVVEDVNKNFYELLEVEQTASQNEIRRAYRKVSLQLHPDKNKDPDAETQFRKLVAAYEVLKDEKLRIKYNEILVNGLPDWRQPVYYYRRVRKMGLIELSFLLSVILTVGHFLVIWSMYLERKFELEEIFRSKKKKDKKSKKQKQYPNSSATSDDDNDGVILPTEVEHLIVKPKFLDLLPFLFFKSVYALVLNLPYFISILIGIIKSSKWFPKPSHDMAENDEEDENFKIKKTRPVTQFTYELAEPSPVLNYTKLTSFVRNEEDEQQTGVNIADVERNSDWTESDTETLVKAIVKFPGGTVERWEKIASFVGKSVKEVTAMSKKLKSNSQPAMSEMNNKIITKRNVDQFLQNVELTVVESDEAVVSTSSSTTTTQLPTSKNKPTTSPTSNSKNIERTLMITKPQHQSNISTATPPQQQTWTQQHQKQLENAMVQIPRDIVDRWDRIAELVSGKSKDECLQRVKHLAEIVKKRKMNTQSLTNNEQSITTQT